MNNIFKTINAFGLKLYYHDVTNDSNYDDIIMWLTEYGCEFLPEQRDIRIGNTIFISENSEDCLMMPTEEFHKFND